MPVGMWLNDLKYRKSLPGPQPKSRILKGISDSIESTMPYNFETHHDLLYQFDNFLN